MNFNFGEVLTRAWQIIWKHKVLWVFGILASCGQGGGGNSGGSGGNAGYSSGDSNFPFASEMERFGRWISDNPWIILVFILAVLLLVMLTVFLGTIGRIGLIKGTYRAEQGEEKLVLGALFSESMPYFWRVFGLTFAIGLVILLIFVPLVLFGALTAGIGFLCLLPLICVLIPVSIVVGILVEQANNAIVLEDLGIMDGLKRGWEILKANVGPVIIMAIILAVIGFVVGLVVAIPIFLAVIPAMIAFLAGDSQDTTPLILVGVCICLYLPVAIVLQGIMTAYIKSAWTLTYMRLTRKPGDGSSPMPESNMPLEPEDSDKTMLSARPNA
jgi:hypothetical protein